MTCSQMLARLIEGDPDALAGRGNSDVAMHVRKCARCRAVADALLAETRMLAAVVDGAAVVRRIRPTPIVLTLAAAAAMTFVMLPDQPTEPATVALAPVVAVTPTLIAPVVVAPALRSTPQTAPRSATAPAASRPAVASTPAAQHHVASAYPAATPMTVSPMRMPSSERPYQQVAVTPPPGKRAAVMRTSDPAITVVWVY